MFSTIKRLVKFWERWGFASLVAIAVVVILILAIFQWNKKGSYNSYIPRDPMGRVSLEGLQRGKSRSAPQPVTTSRRPPRQSKGEVECRRVMEAYFGKAFPSVRPDFLLNPVTSDEGGGPNNLEIDCYNAELKIGVEYNGIQHYKYNAHMHRNKEAFRNQKYRDLIKSQMCKDNGVTLLVVPYTVPVEKIQEYLMSELKKAGKLGPK